MDAKLEQLLATSLQKTKTKELRWAPTNVEAQYAHSFSIGAVVVDEYGDGEMYGVTIVNHEGTAVRSVRSDSDPTSLPLLRALYAAAKESHLRVEETVDGILRELGGG